MSEEYNQYIKEHKDNVFKAYRWLVEHRIVKDTPELDRQILSHDDSKYSVEEYYAYDLYFYGSSKNRAAFNYAWNHHIHSNPHHWQYWIIPGETVLPMPTNYIIEMICDWWSFSFRKGDLTEIFDWYREHSEIILHPATRAAVESFLSQIRRALNRG